MEDIAPQLLESIRREFSERIAVNPKIRALYKRIQEGNATYADAEDYAYLVGQVLSQAFGNHLSSAVLPDGRMYYNIADRVLRPLLEEDHGIISNAAAMVQTALNKKAGIGLKAQTVAVNTGRIDGIVGKVSNAENFDDVAWILDEPVESFSLNVVDEILKANIIFQGRSGLQPKIFRKAERKCCKWCSQLAGKYTYPDVPDDVYRRHNNCRCTVEYDPGDGRRQNVHTKKWTTQEESAKLEARKQIGMPNPGKILPTLEDKKAEYHRPGVQTIRNSELPNGLPIKADAGAILDKTDDFGKVLQRRIYGDDGMADIDFDTSDHNMPWAHPTGAHKHIFDFSKKNPHSQPLPLTDEELEENADIIQRGVNYYDPQ